ncbi:DUF2508 family protein [Cohnella panacarvi]|uniref:DUF2508 family protein n=1 Tax=Cohnella panacarvi TaxID=400776 RepID=UPI00047B3B50|nr:DUF2508 family protein [Cohnella panacarvi]
MLPQFNRRAHAQAALGEASERKQLIEDVRQAEREWALAQWHFDNALGDDRIDYAIFTLEAAEKKLDMLLKQAKWLWKQPGSDGKGGQGE